IFWQRGKDILTANGNVQMTTVVGTRHAQLVITNLTDNDYGTYSCIADNWLGKAELTYQKNKPQQYPDQPSASTVPRPTLSLNSTQTNPQSH
ncbi:hypothetical protein BgiMline_000743, partial [Biomphalaria glabrata]